MTYEDDVNKFSDLSILLLKLAILEKRAELKFYYLERFKPFTQIAELGNMSLNEDEDHLPEDMIKLGINYITEIKSASLQMLLSHLSRDSSFEQDRIDWPYSH